MNHKRELLRSLWVIGSFRGLGNLENHKNVAMPTLRNTQRKAIKRRLLGRKILRRLLFAGHRYNQWE